MIIHHDDPIYSGQFSEDGNFFYSCGHDLRVNMYRTENPREWAHYKTVSHPFGRWTLTDATLSPDNRWLAYTSLTRHVAFAPTDPDDTGESYTLDLGPDTPGQVEGWQSSFGIFSIRFSGDGRELVAGTNSSSIIIYDIETRTVLHRVVGHTEDVNAVCFASTSSPHIFCSGSDDAMVKVRCLNTQPSSNAYTNLK
jgi:WD repeat-containing protein 23